MRVANLQSAYARIGQDLLRHGDKVQIDRPGASSSRTVELLGFDLVVDNPFHSLPIGTGRRLKSAIGAIEALQLVGGWSDPQLQCRVSSNMAAFMDMGAFHGAYGLRVAQQVPLLLRRLRNDASSRQGVLTIWDPLRDGQDGPKDLPCTVMLHFILRRDELHLFAYMRSNDFWWGLAYDVFQFTQLQVTLATVLGVGVGEYRHFVGSFHAYDRDWEAIEALHEPILPHPWIDGLADPGDSWEEVRARTRDVVSNPDGLGHDWYRDQMAPYVG